MAAEHDLSEAMPLALVREISRAELDERIAAAIERHRARLEVPPAPAEPEPALTDEVVLAHRAALHRCLSALLRAFPELRTMSTSAKQQAILGDARALVEEIKP